MTLTEIRNLLKTQKGSLELLKKFTDYFTKINSIENRFFDDNLDIVEARKLLQEVTGYLLKINKAYILLDEKIKTHEMLHVDETRTKAEKRGDKFSIQAARREAKTKIIYEERIFNHFKIYLENCETIKSTLQSILKTLIEEGKIL